ncbi:hypothetical protein VC83_07391 [Pseudogymnoascus destructans]|uniref:PcRGLX/YetA-like C-terminal alpha/alpha toroid domain-containing protein n=2 Tax=Pseudogymnoascus destructans TaxID=655981 RepID=L8G656_PSED2|nr:uncharacterized protein VC83_07391 [Pseudogymnoascus destructans]ELR08730.1 hypothetical protein GMDG_03412 [Pseudogymnoascus destructans 20631-21]OAF56154.1 hypothetical protein VC83_07391 [Pseudogymnoascus destructans]
MHTYDTNRHTWRYDVGGYGWDNSELSLTYSSGNTFYAPAAKTFIVSQRLSPATQVKPMSTILVIGRAWVPATVSSTGPIAQSKPVSRSRSTYFYYLSGGDERIRELLGELLDTEKTYGILDPQRNAALAGGWLIAWERRGLRWEEAKTKLTSTITSIAKLNTLGPPPLDPDNKGLVDVSHLSAVFGLPEVVSEPVEYYGDDLPAGFKEAWYDYCYYYAATPAEARYGVKVKDISLLQAHSRVTAYAAHQTGNTTLAKRAWRDLLNSDGIGPNTPDTDMNGSSVLSGS